MSKILWKISFLWFVNSTYVLTVFIQDTISFIEKDQKKKNKKKKKKNNKLENLDEVKIKLETKMTEIEWEVKPFVVRYVCIL